jgi:predicted ribonuclease YlaK
MPPGNQLATLIHAELEVKRHNLTAVGTYLEGHLGRMRRSPGLPIVVDSNVLLQSQRPDNVNWNRELKTTVRIMLPLRVIEEIDAKKYSKNDRLRDRARELLPWINSLFPNGDTGPITLREDDATIELLLADRPRHRPDDADEEILDVCHDVVRFAGRGKLMTGDTSMRLRAISEGLEVLFLPAGWDRDARETSGSG